MGACVPRAVGFAVCLRATVHGTNKSKMLLGRLIGGAGWDIGSAADVVKALRLKSRRDGHIELADIAHIADIAPSLVHCRERKC